MVSAGMPHAIIAMIPHHSGNLVVQTVHDIVPMSVRPLKYRFFHIRLGLVGALLPLEPVVVEREIPVAVKVSRAKNLEVLRDGYRHLRQVRQLVVIVQQSL